MTDKHQLHRGFGGLLHHQLASVIRDSIVSGRFAVGHLLPAELELCEQFSVSRITVRRAMQSLVEEGRVERQRGRGTFVRGTVPLATMDVRSAMPSLTGATAQLTANMLVKVTAFDFVPAPEEVRLALRLGSSARVLRVDRMRFSEQLPVLQATVYLPESIGKHFSPQDFASVSLLKLMARKKKTYGRVEVHCTAMLASPVLAKAFGILIGAPLIEFKKLAFDKAGKPLEYLHAVAPPDRYQVKISFEGSGDLTM